MVCSFIGKLMASLLIIEFIMSYVTIEVAQLSLPQILSMKKNNAISLHNLVLGDCIQINALLKVQIHRNIYCRERVRYTLVVQEALFWPSDQKRQMHFKWFVSSGC